MTLGSDSVHLTGRLSFLSAGERRTAEAALSAAYAAGLPEAGVSVDGLLIVFDAAVPMARRSEALAALRSVSHSAWGGRIRAHVEGPEADELLFAGGPSARGMRAKGSVSPLTFASRWKAERARTPPADATPYRFRREDCTVLVLYALSASHDRPDEDDPRFVYGTPPDGVGLLGAMPAPSSRIVTREDFVVGLQHAIGGETEGQRLDPWAAVHLGEALSWSVETGCPWFGYMLEPAAIAGHGTAERLGIEANVAAPVVAAPNVATMAAEALAPDPVPGADQPRRIPPTRVDEGFRDAVRSWPGPPAPPVSAAASASPSTSRALPSAPSAGRWEAPPAPVSAALGGWGSDIVPRPISAESVPVPSAPRGARPAAALTVAMGGHAGDRSSLLKALARNLGETAEQVARRVATHVVQSPDAPLALGTLVGVANDGSQRADMRGDAVVALAMLGGYHRMTLPEAAFRPLLDGALRLEAMDSQRLAGFRALLDVAPRRPPYEALRGSF